MNNELQDKQYIALELTKILFGDKVKFQKEQVYVTYQYFLLNVANIYNTIDTFELLKNENERLEKEISELRSNNRGNFENFIKDFKDFIEENKGDMEPRVYSGLINLCNKKI